MKLSKQEREFVKVCIVILGLQWRVRVRVRVGRWIHDNTEVSALYWHKETWHLIETRRKSNRGNFKTLVAHELCHAWCVENHPRAKDHGATFIRCATGLQKTLTEWGFKVSDLYLPECDK